MWSSSRSAKGSMTKSRSAVGPFPPPNSLHGVRAYALGIAEALTPFNEQIVHKAAWKYTQMHSLCIVCYKM